MINYTKIPDQIIYILKQLNKKGEAYIVGGAVRDIIIDCDINDWDIATSLLPNEIIKLFNNHKVIETGKRYGTITVIIDNMPVEITTYRTEEDYIDSRHPNKVEFVSNIEQDLSRRDFTINAIAYNPLNAKVFIDPYNGVIDIKNKVINTVGNPTKRFTEDPLRILRAIRFASRLNYSINTTVGKSIINQVNSIKNISIERIQKELNLILQSKNAGVGILLLHKYKMLQVVYDLLEIEYSLEHITEISRVINSCQKSLVSRISVLFYYTIFDEYNLNKALKKLKYDKKHSKAILDTIKWIGILMKYDSKLIAYDIRKMASHIGLDNTNIVLDIVLTISKVNNNDDKNKHITDACILAHNICINNDPLRINDLAINGNDILGLDIEIADKSEIGKLLNKALDMVLHDPQKNKKEILLNLLFD